MKKILLIAVALVLFCASSSWAAYTLASTEVIQEGHVLVWKVVCTTDTGNLSATNLITGSSMPAALVKKIQKSMFMYMDVIPGTTTAAPNGTLTVTLTDELGVTKYSHASIAYDANTGGLDLAEDTGYVWLCTNQFNLALTWASAPDAGDTVTLVFHMWIEDI